MTGATRQKVQLDLLGAQLRLQRECCHPHGPLSDSMHDPCVGYHLTQEHNELINVHDWYQSFSSICCPVKVSSAKKGKGGKSEGSAADPGIIQYQFLVRFCKESVLHHAVGYIVYFDWLPFMHISSVVYIHV
ncbi:hypothetical protein KC19_12G105700 [Ceratodon purpureus]|uniref:Origin recognition complex subunit 3 winged helix C-terminal domain-containing protein n=1 Tax=Ceratodon purpureus TaxID=3225 RepID=A0A8T0G6R7_CERPU|nr:hypothetical protein KC19_12G105700 [Ceratodon purpureus]